MVYCDIYNSKKLLSFKLEIIPACCAKIQLVSGCHVLENVQVCCVMNLDDNVVVLRVTSQTLKELLVLVF